MLLLFTSLLQLKSQTKIVICHNGKFSVEGNQSLVVICMDDGPNNGKGFAFLPPKIADTLTVDMSNKRIVEKSLSKISKKTVNLTSQEYDNFLKTGFVKIDGQIFSINIPSNVTTEIMEFKPTDKLPNFEVPLSPDEILNTDRIKLQELIEIFNTKSPSKYTLKEKAFVYREIEKLKSSSYIPNEEIIIMMRGIINKK